MHEIVLLSLRGNVTPPGFDVVGLSGGPHLAPEESWPPLDVTSPHTPVAFGLARQRRSRPRAQGDAGPQNSQPNQGSGGPMPLRKNTHPCGCHWSGQLDPPHDIKRWSIHL